MSDTLSADQFDEVYGFVENENETIFFEKEDLDKRTPKVELHHVWTIVECDDDQLVLMPGYRFCNRIGYVISNKPWLTGQEEAFFDDGKSNCGKA